MKKYQLSDSFILFKQPKSLEINLWKLGKEIPGDDVFFIQSFDTYQKETFSPVEKNKIPVNKFNPNWFNDIEINILSQNNAVSKKDYLLICKKLIDYICNSELQKVILSRIKKIKPIANPVSHFFYLTQKYPNAMVYLWGNNQGFWLGATPETLAIFNDNQFSTMALAGTKKTDNKIKWTKKEYDEHNFVKDYIADVLKDFTPELSSTETIDLGNLKHLITHIKANVPKQRVLEIIEALHPTPAICGYPKQSAKNWILKNEIHNRDFYTGFLGIKIEENIFSYVNLRCAKLYKNSTDIYVGGGITKDSNPLAEWNETELKATSLT